LSLRRRSHEDHDRRHDVGRARPGAGPYALAASPDGEVLLATSESGLIRSIDAGATWTSVERAPLLQVVD
jgi:streptogramin lyase